MTLNKLLKITGLWLVLAALLAGGLLYPVETEGATPDQRLSFNPILTMAGMLETGALGLPGEQVTWLITVSNPGDFSGNNLVISTVLRPELRLENVIIERGSAAASAQNVTVMIPQIAAGETLQVQLVTIVVQGPTGGILFNEASLSVQGPQGTVTRSAAAQIPVVAGLPATGYPPAEDLPGDGEPSVIVVALVALAVVLVTAAFVWWRGRRWWRSAVA